METAMENTLSDKAKVMPTMLHDSALSVACEPTVAELQATLDAKLAELPGLTPRRATWPAAWLQSLREPEPPEVVASREAEHQERLRQDRENAKHAAWSDLIRARGSRYDACRLSTFAVACPEQRAALDSLTGYCESITANIREGHGLILFGPKGTGKDHLAMAAARCAIGAGRSIRWQNGMDLFGDIRDAMDTGESERSLVNRLSSPDVLYLSDPLPPMGKLTEFQASMLFRVLDARYSRRMATWVTVNVSSGAELDERLGPQNGDRLRDEALAIFCNWGSYRKVAQ